MKPQLELDPSGLALGLNFYATDDDGYVIKFVCS